MPVRSMTGYARVRRSTPDGDLTLSVKSVNHRGLDLHFHMPSDLDPFENDLRETIKRHVSRGHLEVRAALLRKAQAPEAALNEPLVATYVAAFQRAASQFGLGGEPDLNAALRIPGMLSPAGNGELRAETARSLLESITIALEELNAFREREGAAIAGLLRERNAAIRQAVVRIGEIRSRALPAFQARLQTRLAEILKGAGVEPQRIVQEAAILADRTDIGEEVARLEIHGRQVDDLLAGGGELGKKLDFLLQEMNREAGTILAKTSGIGETGLEITELALAVKADVEKMREQTLNLE